MTQKDSVLNRNVVDYLMGASNSETGSSLKNVIPEDKSDTLDEEEDSVLTHDQLDYLLEVLNNDYDDEDPEEAKAFNKHSEESTENDLPVKDRTRVLTQQEADLVSSTVSYVLQELGIQSSSITENEKINQAYAKGYSDACENIRKMIEIMNRKESITNG